jgi:hypothetical protein
VVGFPLNRTFADQESWANTALKALLRGVQTVAFSPPLGPNIKHVPLSELAQQPPKKLAEEPKDS